MESIEGKNILITGAARGMGRIYAELAVKEKAKSVVLWDLNQALLDEVVTSLEKEGVTKLHSYCFDLSQSSLILQYVEKVLSEVGEIEILINNAGVVCGKYFWEHDYQHILQVMSVNALAPMMITRAFLPTMMGSNKTCRIVNIASAAGLFATEKMSVYCASKWACTGWSEALRIDLKQKNINHLSVTTVNPTYIATGMFEGVKSLPLAPLLDPHYVVNKVWKAMKKGKPRVYLPGSVYLLVALRGILPLALFEWILEKWGVFRSMHDFQGRK